MEYKTCPDAKIFLASDYGWWKEFYTDAKATLNPDCELWTTSTSARREFRLNFIEGLRGPGFSDRFGKAHLIGLSGYPLIQRVSWEKPKLMLLTGFDTQRTEEKSHAFGDYPDSCKSNPRHKFNNVPHLPIRKKDGSLELSDTDKKQNRTTPRQVECFDILAKQCPIKIINCSRETALTCFERATIQEVLE